MNEQRTQTYLNLINQLLSCNNSDEPQILQENQELLDEVGTGNGSRSATIRECRKGK